MFRIYHNPRCRKSRAGLEYLNSKTQDFEIIDYLKNPLSKSELSEIFDKLDQPPVEMVRKQEQIFKDEFKGKNFSDDEWLEAMAKYPKLIHRPIVVKGDKAIFAQPPEAIDQLF